MSIYILCAVVLAVAVPLAWWLKREGERSWARHQEMVRRQREREQIARMAKAFAEVRIVFEDRMTPALAKVTAEMRRLADSLGGGAS